MDLSPEDHGNRPSKELHFLSSVHWKNIKNSTSKETNTNPLQTPSNSQPAPRARKSYSDSRKYKSTKRKGSSSATEGVEDETVTRLLGDPVVSPSQKETVTNVDRVSTTPDACTHAICLPCAPTPEAVPVPPLERDKSNVILPWKGLLEFLCRNFCCNLCKKSITEAQFEKLQVSFATSVNYFCPGCNVDALQAETRKTLAPNKQTNRDPTKVSKNRYAINHAIEDYALNQKMILSMQQLGSGRAGGAVLGGMLSIFVDPMASYWTDIESEIGKAQVGLGKDILKANIEEEKSLSSVDSLGRSELDTNMDGAWNNRGSGKSYNSDSGHHLIVGNRTKKVIACHYMSRRCAKCELEMKAAEKANLPKPVTKDHDEDLCPRNYDGSSKGMECNGSFENVNELHTKHNCVMHVIVMDDDSSSENILQWEIKSAMEKELLTTWPLTPSGARRSNKGKLPLSHPPWTKLADHNHRMRCLAGKCYKLARAKLEISKVTTADAERLKRNVCYAVHQYKSEDFPTFKKSVWAVLHHHFGCHDTCGEWCPWLKNKDKPEELKKLFYGSKDTDKAIYEQILEIWNTYCSDQALHEIHHEWHTNKCESMNKFITKFINKSTHLCRSIVGKARTYLAVGLDSIGYEEYYRTLFGILGLDYDERICGLSHRRLDKKKIWHKNYSNKLEVRRARCLVRALKIRENIRKVLQDKKDGKTYATGMNGPKLAKKPKKEKGTTKPSVPCSHCGKLGHKMRTHRDCGESTYKKKGKYTWSGGCLIC
jgi:hypothetical protein